MKNEIIKIGTDVMHRDSWGTDVAKETTILGIEKCESADEKYGVEVDTATYSDGQWDGYYLFTLLNGKWAYSYQVTPMNKAVN